MSSLRTLIVGFIALVGLTAPAVSLPHSPSARVQLFATCAGRLSALEEHQRMFDGPASEQTAQHKAMFDEIISALMPDARAYGLPGRQALAWQIEAKMAHAVLMQRATFSTDPRAKERAQIASQARLSQCQGLLLGA